MPNNFTDLNEAIIAIAENLNEKMDDLLPQVSNCKEAKVLEAMRYSAISGGKKMRPFLVTASAGLFGVSREVSIQTAAAIEFIHVYSLIHDDLPAMDDDDVRRGKPACHIQFGEAAAILAGDGLLTLAFEILADDTTHPNPAVRCELIKAAARASGVAGMVGGQMMDLDAEHSTLTIDEIIHLQRMKTGQLFMVSCEAGAILGKAAPNLRMALRGYANAIGLAFQITDDLLDAEGTREETGKKVGKDNVKGKATLVSAIGADKARNQAKMLVQQAKTHLEPFDKRADILRKLADYIIDRKK